MRTLPSVLMGGVLPFGVVFVELFFILSSIYQVFCVITIVHILIIIIIVFYLSFALLHLPAQILLPVWVHGCGAGHPACHVHADLCRHDLLPALFGNVCIFIYTYTHIYTYIHISNIQKKKILHAYVYI